MSIKHTQNITIGDKVKIARQNLGLLQSELSRRLDLSRGVCGRWERGLANPPLSKIQQVAEVLQVSVDWLTDTNPEHNSQQNLTQTIEDNLNNKLYAWIQSLNITQKQTLLDMVVIFDNRI